jgi:hypothetical protein
VLGSAGLLQLLLPGGVDDLLVVRHADGVSALDGDLVVDDRIERIGRQGAEARLELTQLLLVLLDLSGVLLWIGLQLGKNALILGYLAVEVVVLEGLVPLEEARPDGVVADNRDRLVVVGSDLRRMDDLIVEETPPKQAEDDDGNTDAEKKARRAL